MVAQHKLSIGAVESLQDLDIFHMVRVQQRNVDAVADLFRITYLEVREAVARVTERLLAAAPIDEDEAGVQRRQHLSEQIAAERLAWLFGLAVQGHRRALQDVTTTRTIGHGDTVKPVSTTRSSGGQSRWLLTAAKLAQIAATIPAVPIHDPLLAEISRDNAAAPEDTFPADPAENSPDGDCSAADDDQPVTAPVADDQREASADPVMACVETYLAAKDAKKCAPRPVQAAVHGPVQSANSDRQQTSRERAREEFLSG